ncbi:MAG: hypothetical protein H7062_08240 [Candidatus Saccharimonas sp.]|nr:hypothetical protein [Planctomycetaceae bacterium]
MATAYAERIDERVVVLQTLVAELQGFPEESSRLEFTRQFNDARMVLEQSDTDLARLFRISRPTASRWRSGDSAPHDLGRKAVFNALARVAKDKLRAISR